MATPERDLDLDSALPDRPALPDPEPVGAVLDRARSGEDIERTVFFSDAVFAIAMTLLVLDLRVAGLGADVTSEQFREAFLDKVPAFIGFVLSFAIIALIWLTHHRRFRLIRAYDARLQAFNLVLLALVAFMPVPTALLFERNGGSAIPPILYAVTVSLLFAALDLVWWHAHRRELLAPDVSEAFYRHALRATFPVPVMFLLSVPIALFNVSAAMYFWIALWPIDVVYSKWSRARFVREAAVQGAAAHTTVGTSPGASPSR